MTMQFSRLGTALARRSFVTAVFATVFLVFLPVHRAGRGGSTVAHPAQHRRLSARGAETAASIAAPCTNFAVIRVADGATVFPAKSPGRFSDPDTQEQLYTADFSKLKQPGDYQLDVPGVGRSAPFRVATDIYREPFYVVMRGFYLWRCGTAVSATYQGITFAHDICHTNDAWLDFVGGGHTQKDGTKGWHDAGDYNKYAVNAGVTVGVMFRAWEDFGPQIKTVRLDLPESGGPLPDFLAEIKWELDWLLTMQAPDGSVYHKLSTTQLWRFRSAGIRNGRALFHSLGQRSHGGFCGHHWRRRRGFSGLTTRPLPTVACKPPKRVTGFFRPIRNIIRPTRPASAPAPMKSTNPTIAWTAFPENRLWAAAEIWETTGDPDALRDLENRIRAVHGKVDSDFDWDEVKDLGLLTYLFSERPGSRPGSGESGSQQPAGGGGRNRPGPQSRCLRPSPGVAFTTGVATAASRAKPSSSWPPIAPPTGIFSSGHPKVFIAIPVWMR